MNKLRSAFLLFLIALFSPAADGQVFGPGFVNDGTDGVFLSSAPPAAPGLSQPVPTERLINWNWYVGVENKPASTTVYTNIPVISAFEINRVVTNCYNSGTNRYIVFSNQTYNLSEPIYMMSGVRLRGQGTNTYLREPTTGGTHALIHMGQKQGAPRVNLDISSGASKGSTNITLVSTLAGDLAVGQPFVVTATNDWNYVHPFGYEPGTPTPWAGDAPDTPATARNQGETVRLTSISGNDITFWPPLASHYSTTPARITYVPSWQYQPIEYVGVENMAIGVPTNAPGLLFESSNNSWVSNVTFRIFGNEQAAVFGFNMNYRVTVQRCTFSGFSALPAALDIRNDCSGWLVENNWFKDIYQAVIFTSRGNNHVVAGNYSHNLGAGTAEYITHGSHKSFIYWAHNRGIGMWSDDVHGSASHGVWFRDWLLGVSGATEYGSMHFDQFNYSNSIVATVLGYSALAGFIYEKSPPTAPSTRSLIWWDYVGAGVFATQDNGGMHAKDSAVVHNLVTYESGSATIRTDPTRTTTMTNCYYYGAPKPAWWPASLAYPAIGPDVSGYTNQIPSQYRFFNADVDAP